MRFLRHILCLAVVLIAGRGAVSHAEHAAPELHVKAAILFNLVRFSVWPEIAEDSFNLCTLTNKDMQSALNSLEGKQVHGIPLKLTHLKSVDDFVPDCQVLYSSKELTEVPLDFEKVHSHGTLTIGDTPDFLASGGCMSIQRRGKKMRFSISRKAIKMANVRPSSKILQLAVDLGVAHD